MGDPTLRTVSSELRTPNSELAHVSSPIRIVYVIDDLGMGGAQRQLTELLKALPRQSFEVHVVSLSAERLDYASTIRGQGIPLSLIAHRGKWSWTTLGHLMRLLRDIRPTIVHTWLFTADLYGRLAAWFMSVPVIISAVRSIDPWKPYHYVLMDKLLRHVTDAFSVNAKAIGDVLQVREGIDPLRVHTIYNGVDITTFDPSLKDESIRQKIGLGSDVPLVGIVGRLAPEKDHETFLRAAAILLRRCPQTHFLIVGNGPLQPSLEGLAAGLGMSAHVHFLENQSPITPVFAALDILVVSSHYEGCCNVILEAMAMEKPVVATAVGGNPELVVPAQTGLLVPPQDPQALAQALFRLVDDPNCARNFGRQARQRVETRFTNQQMIAHMMNLYATQLKLKSCKMGRQATVELELTR